MISFIEFSTSILYRRQREIRENLIHNEVDRRVKEIVEIRVREELERRKDEIENEVKRRVDVLRRTMEKQMLIELEKRNHEEIKRIIEKEVDFKDFFFLLVFVYLHIGRRKKET